MVKAFMALSPWGTGPLFETWERLYNEAHYVTEVFPELFDLIFDF